MVDEPHKRAEIVSRSSEFMVPEASKPFGWSPANFVDWATVEHMLDAIALPAGSSIIDIGCGAGWTSLFLAEAGYQVVGYDLVPANVEVAQKRAERWTSSARFEVADMEALPPGEPADAALIFDSLHHSARQRETLHSAASRLRSGGWLLLGEPSWLHRLSRVARADRRELGWLERGIALGGLRCDLRAASFGEIRRFFQPTSPYENRVHGFAWQLTRLVAANAWVAPHSKLWLAARRVR